MKWKRNSQLRSGQTPRPILWTKTWHGPLPLVNASDLPVIHGDLRKSSRIRVYGNPGDRRKTDITPHFIATRNGYPMHTDPGFTRYEHSVVIYNDGWRVAGLSGYKDPQPRGTVMCLDTHSPHAIVTIRDPRGIHRLVCAVDAPEPLDLAQVVQLLSPLLSNPRAHMEAM